MSPPAFPTTVPVGELCDVCSAIDFESYFRQARDCHYDSQGLPTARTGAHKLGNLGDVYLKAQKCPFCWLVIQAICTSEVAWEKSPEELMRREQCASSPTSCYLYSYRFARNEMWEESAPAAGAFRIAIAYRTTSPVAFSSREDKVGDIQLFGEDARRTLGSMIFCGRAVRPKLDIDLATYWLNSCEENHGQYCGALAPVEHGSGRLSELPERLLVVDVNQQCVVDLPSSSAYMTLSYCWPPRTDTLKLLIANERQLRSPGSLTQMHGRLPGAIWDAINLVRDMGETYLWVDALCIIQDSKEHKDDQLGQMDKVYGRSRLTIVPVMQTHDAEKACKGLPRYNTDIPCRKQKVASVKGLRLAVTFECILGFAGANSCRWSCRGWTYQECVLSRRILFLTQTQAYFQCRCSVFCEDTFGEVNTIRTSIAPFTNLYNAGAPFTYQPIIRSGFLHLHPQILGHDKIAIGEYVDHVTCYTARSLTYASDSINAFRGMQEVLQYCLGSEFWCGMPEKYWDSALLFNINNGWPRTATSGDTFPRNKGFPSWSWVGWDCLVESEFFFEQASGIKREVEWFLVSNGTASYAIETKELEDEGLFPGPGNKSVRLGSIAPDALPPRRPRAQFKAMVSQTDPPLLHLACWTMTCDLEVSKTRVSLGSLDNARKHVAYHPILDENDRWVGSIRLMDPSIWSRGVGERRVYKFILMSRSRSILSGVHADETRQLFDQTHFPTREWCFLNVMAIQMEGGIGERCGLGVIHEDAWLQMGVKEMLVKLR